MPSRTLLALSLALNLFLAGLLFDSPEGHPQPNQSAAAARPTPSLDSDPSKSAVSATSPARWTRWSDLEADDYPTYMANLRAFGCPEATLKDIIAGDLASLYAQKEADLSSQGLSPQQLAAARANFSAERTHCMEVLFPCADPASDPSKCLPSPNNSPEGLVAQRSAPSGQPASPALPPPSDPLILLPPDASLGLDEAQRNSWQNLQKQFAMEMTPPGTFQNPYDPEYRRRWDQAQQEIDDIFHAQFGDDAYNALVLRRNALANKMR